MLRYNCGCFIGSIVNRAQGYKRLREEVGMSSKYSVSHKGSIKKQPVYYLVTKNVVARNLHKECNQTLYAGYLVVLEQVRPHIRLFDVKLVDLEKKSNSPIEVVYRCPPDCLLEIDPKVWSLIAAVSSPVLKLRIAKNTELCEELSCIELGSIVQVLTSPSASIDTREEPPVYGIVTFKGPVPGLGPGTYFRVELVGILFLVARIRR